MSIEASVGFEIIDIRRFEPQDFSELLALESQAWANRLHWDFASSARVISACLREKRLSGYAFVSQGRIRGYCFFFYDSEKGIIGDLFLDPALAGLGHEYQLLDHTLETLLGTPGLLRIEAQLPHYEEEDLESCFLPRQFQSYLRRFMGLSLPSRAGSDANGAGHPAGHASGKPSLLEDIEHLPWEKRFEASAAELLYQSYRHHVDAAINDQYASQTGAARLIENIVHHQGCGEFLSRISRMAVHRPTQQLAGILTVTRVRPHTAHIPQVGVATAFQGRGLGTALMSDAFGELAREGFKEATLTVTDANAGAVRLYQRLGFETFKTFGAFTYNRAEIL